jgi:hypothetical protein
MTFRERLTAHERHLKFEPFVAQVTKAGNLDWGDGHRLSARESLRLARWIAKMFGEPAP